MLINILRFDSKYKNVKSKLMPIFSRGKGNGVEQWSFTGI